MVIKGVVKKVLEWISLQQKQHSIQTSMINSTLLSASLFTIDSVFLVNKVFFL